LIAVGAFSGLPCGFAGRDLTRLVLALGLGCALALGTHAQTNVTTQHNDIARTGANTNETILTPANVNPSAFGKLFSYPVDGWMYAQPLYMPGVTMGAGTPQAGTTRNVVFVATEHDSVYAFDADSNTGANANPLWQAPLIGAGEEAVPNPDISCSDIVPEIGITSTPVIDPATNTLYVVAKTTVGDTTFIQRLHALDITTGNEKLGGPTILAASVPGNGNGSSGGTLHLDPKWQLNRAGLLLVNGIVYIGFGSHCDNGPWHGWILAYSATTLQQTGAWCPSPNSIGSGVWGGGTGLAADVPAGKPYGRIFLATGNGIYDATAPNYTDAMDYGDSIVKLDLTNGVPTMNTNGTVVGDDFTPLAQANLNNADEDQGSGGTLLLPNSELTQVGKSGIVYVLNRENLGGYNPNNTKDPQEAAYVGGVWGAPAYWNGNVYVWGQSDHLKTFTFVNGLLSANPTSTSAEIAGQSFGTYSPTPSVSANGTTNGIVWSLQTDNFGSQGREILYAHDASNVANLLYSSGTTSSDPNFARDNPGNSVKFIVPTVVNGKVYVGSESQLSVFGLLSGSTQAATPVISPASQSFNPSIQVTITDSTSGASVYYTTDGSTPTTASTKYTTPFTLTTTSTVNAIAAGMGLLQSAEASAAYSLTTQVATPTLNPAPGSYSAVQSVAINTTTPNATVYYTTDGTTPTTSSTKYTGPVSIGVTETLSATAVASGLSSSPVVSGVYTIDLGGVSSINFATGFASGGMNLIGTAKLNGSSLELTDGGDSEAAAAWYQVEANIDSFTTDFTFQITLGTNPTADGFAFAIQGNNSTALGPYGGGLGFGPDAPSGTGGIPSSMAVKFDLFSNAGEGADSTGLFLNGASPTTPAVDMTGSGVDLHSGDPFHVHMTYDGTTLVMTITDTSTNATFTASWPVDIPTIVGDDAAYVGFTAGTGGYTAVQNIQTWMFTSGSGQTIPAPSFSPAAGTYLGTQMVTVSDAASSATIFYTTDGSTPTTSSAQYTGPIAITTTQTIKAIAAATAISVSAVGTATYTIESQVTTPTFSPAGGTYPSVQTVTISTTSPNATIYYTTNGTTPTTASTQYAGPITVSATQTIQAIASASGYFDSNVASATYTIRFAAATPTFSPAPGMYTSAQSVTISDATPDSAIYYTTDGTVPTSSSTLYAGAITVKATETINALAAAPGYSNSAVATAVYTVVPPDFALSAASANLTVQSGGQGTDVITIAPQNGSFESAVLLTCSVRGPAPMPTCAFSAVSVTPGANSVTSTLTITVSTATTLLFPFSPAQFAKSLYAVWIPLLFGITGVGGLKKKRLHNWALGCCLALLVLSLAACGGGNRNSTASHQPTTYMVTIVGTSGSIQHTTQVTVMAQ
jgi:Legume lectin domain/Chitobiase/beta-hexosaminidase C-terminal domain